MIMRLISNLIKYDDSYMYNLTYVIFLFH